MAPYRRMGRTSATVGAVLAVASLLLAPAAAQFQQLQSPAQRQLLILVQDIQNRLAQQQDFVRQQQQDFLRQQGRLQAQAVQAVPQVIVQEVVEAVEQPQRRVIEVQPQPQPQLQPARPRQGPRPRPQPPANDSAKPQFLEPGVGRWLINGDPACLPCICEAASGCDETLGCDDRGFCGPFLLSKRYWTLAGKPLLRGDSPDRPGAASDCLRDSFCAAEAVRGYLDRFAQDCDGNKRVDCFDLARVHFQGPFNCRSPLNPPSDFSDTFRRCWDASRQNNGQ
ncbi:Lysozyme [Frankliniella fusca]|uniref:lysozyme n=1 Tax=Frankliniella fusca TaxID=407009 RepID=A0AAE1H0Y4_9NEOP|nr:Lysozyme [Frankliniella fusca]